MKRLILFIILFFISLSLFGDMARDFPILLEREFVRFEIPVTFNYNGKTKVLELTGTEETMGGTSFKVGAIFQLLDIFIAKNKIKSNFTDYLSAFIYRTKYLTVVFNQSD